MPTIGLIHSTRLVIDPVHRVLASGGLSYDIIHTLDETLLRDLRESDRKGDRLLLKLRYMGENLVRGGADLIVVSCSSLSPYLDDPRLALSVPLLKVDEPMVEYAVSHGSRIGIVATNPTTVQPTRLLIKQVSERFKKNVSIQTAIVEQAFISLNQGDVERHDRLVLEAVDKLLGTADLVMIAQISAARAMLQVRAEVKERVLSSLPFLADKIDSHFASN